MQLRNVKMDEILDLVACAEDYGHHNGVCMSSLYDWAKPVTEHDFRDYADRLAATEGYEREDGDEAFNRLVAWKKRCEP